MADISGTMGTVRSGVVRDDRIFPEIKPIATFIVLVLLAAVTILYLMPDRTKDLFAWNITPTMTPLLMGAGYLSGAWFFIRAIFSSKWHHFGNGFLAITTFTWFMGLATFLNPRPFLNLPASTPVSPADWLNPANLAAAPLSFYAWLILYIVTPFLVPFLWYRNRVTDPGTPDPDDVVVPAMVRQMALVTGVVLLIIALAVFLLADVIAVKSAAAPNGLGIWPWNTSPLTTRVIGGWFALPGVVGLILCREPRWSAWRILIESQMIALVLILVGVVRAWGDFHQDNPLTWVFILGIAALLGGATTLYLTMESRRRRQIAVAPA